MQPAPPPNRWQTVADLAAPTPVRPAEPPAGAPPAAPSTACLEGLASPPISLGQQVLLGGAAATVARVVEPENPRSPADLVQYPQGAPPRFLEAVPWGPGAGWMRPEEVAAIRRAELAASASGGIVVGSWVRYARTTPGVSLLDSVLTVVRGRVLAVEPVEVAPGRWLPRVRMQLFPLEPPADGSAPDEPLAADETCAMPLDPADLLARERGFSGYYEPLGGRELRDARFGPGDLNRINCNGCHRRIGASAAALTVRLETQKAPLGPPRTLRMCGDCRAALELALPDMQLPPATPPIPLAERFAALVAPEPTATG